MSPRININERSWGIDLISEINLFLRNKNITIKAAGGENTLRGAANSLFPDVLLFSDTAKSGILQGWELKMPDTSINDDEFIRNASKKARLLSLNSFLLWNVSTAKLYLLDGDEYVEHTTWNIEGNVIRTRQDVTEHNQAWKDLLENILHDLNDLFSNGTIARKRLVENLSFSAITEVILENSNGTAEELKTAERSSRNFRAEVDYWWRAAKADYNDARDKYLTLSKVVLTNWVVKFLFANILKRNFNDARQVEAIEFGTSVTEGIDLFERISSTCNFWNIFSRHLGQEYISTEAWGQLVQINDFLKDINLESIDVTVLQELLQTSILRTARRTAGQFSTPEKLAEILAKLTVDDVSGFVLDPCCGTGTIINQAYKLKLQYNLNDQDSIATTWASDKYAFPLQLATLLLSRPANYGQILRIFREDVTDLEIGRQISFINPGDGSIVELELPQFNYIVSNLPFVQQEDLKVLNPNVKSINEWIIEQTGENVELSGKSDLYAYIPFYLHKILSDNGKVGLILSNAWLGTLYGETFIKLLRKFYDVEAVIVSGRGIWFKNAAVVASILILNKKSPNQENNINTKFCTLKVDIDSNTDTNDILNPIILNASDDIVVVQEYSSEQIASFIDLGLPWNSHFADLNWILEIQDRLKPVTDYFSIGRGERRGWNAMFYPNAQHGIENEYIKPVLKNLRSTTSLTAIPNKIAFSCSKTIEELEDLNHNGAIAWIRSFENQNNNTGEPLPISLRRANHQWYEMKTDTLADFVANINYDRSLFIARLAERSFVDQRVIPLIKREDYSELELDFFHALLNSTFSMFFIEALGFGRGMGALDLNSVRFKSSFKILDPDLIDEDAKQRVVESFRPLTNRNRLPLLDELNNPDRVLFEQTLLREYNLEDYWEPLYQALTTLYSIRFAVND
ncbi:MAG: SAM-dependent DNA methyltransferase [Chitinophagales bacterium]|nr:SAM-dependent DNA methyltransferase [Chitinophagales bacterium]